MSGFPSQGNQNGQNNGFGGQQNQQNQQGGFGGQQFNPQQGQPQQGGFGGQQPQQGGFPSQQGQPQQGGFGGQQPQQGQQFNPQGQQPQPVQQGYTPDKPLSGISFATRGGDRLKLSDNIGKYAVLRLVRTEIATVKGNPKKALICDVVLTNGNEVEDYPGQSIINSAVVSVGEQIMRGGIGAMAGRVGYGEARGGNNAPVVIEDISDNKEIADALESLARDRGWVE